MKMMMLQLQKYDQDMSENKVNLSPDGSMKGNQKHNLNKSCMLYTRQYFNKDSKLASGSWLSRKC